jgi:phosphoribosylaminoimidazole-succinocarboxamide synthase
VTHAPSLPLFRRGKVREMYVVDDRHLLMVASDRVSAFDVVMNEPIPGKGAVLTALSKFWFERTREVVPNHFVSQKDERALLVRRAERIDIE